MRLTCGPLGTVPSELFRTPVRHTGNSLSFNFAVIPGAALALCIATVSPRTADCTNVGYHLSTSAVLILIGLLLICKTKDGDLVSSKV
jgi:hypothetical protein